ALLQYSECSNQFRWHGLPADIEMDQGSSRLRAIISIIGDPNFSHAVGFHARLLGCRACGVHRRARIFPAGPPARALHCLCSALPPALLMANILARESCSFSRKHTAERLCAQPLVSSLARQFVRDHCHSSVFLKRPASCTALVPSYRRVFGNLCDTMCPGVSRIRLRLRTERIGGVSPNRPGPRRSRSRRRPERALSTVCGHQGLSHGISIPAWSSSRGS